MRGQIDWQYWQHLGLCELRLAPDLFWSLTPRELLVIAGLDFTANGSLDREALLSLMARYPDHPVKNPS